MWGMDGGAMGEGDCFPTPPTKTMDGERKKREFRPEKWRESRERVFFAYGSKEGK